MKQKFINFFRYLFLALFCLSTTISYAQITPDVLIYRTDEAPSIDGIIDPLWEDFPEIPIEKPLSGEISSNEDLSAYYKTIWDINNLYIIIVVNDNIKTNDSEVVLNDDAVELFLDIGNDKLTSYGDDDYSFVFGWNDLKFTESKHKNIYGVTSKQSDTDNGYIIEIKFQWNSLGQNSFYDDIFLGLDINIHDDDDGADRDAQLSWFGTEADWWSKDPHLFATAKLQGTTQKTSTLQKPIFSVKRGFYNSPFELEINSTTENAIIKYTLDGSNPRYSLTAINETIPTKINIDPKSNIARGKTPAVVVRALVQKDTYEPSDIETHTYIFTNDVKTQTFPGGVWPDENVNGQVLDYEIDPDVVNDSRYSDLIEDALTDIPSISIVTANENLFDEQIGIYVNAKKDGKEWERPSSVELINPDDSDGFQIDCGLRIRGGSSRSASNAKHAFRLFFRSEYGKAKLNFPLFGDEGASEFDKVDIRTSQNYSWTLYGNERNTMNRDVYSRDLQGEMNQPYTRSRYYHLYINGLYWGLFQTQERSEARFGSTYLGGNKEDYDVIKSKTGDIEAVDGNLDAWQEIWNFAEAGFENNENYYKIQGLNTDRSRNNDFKVLLDVDNLIDYMITIFYTGNFDAPVSSFMNNNKTNNFYAIYNKNDDEGFKFLNHDAEHTLLIDEFWPGHGINEDRVNIADQDDMKMEITDFLRFNPQWLHHKLSFNPEYRIKFADRVYKHFFNNGPIVPENAEKSFIKRSEEIQLAIIAESARWGDAKKTTPYTKEHWQLAINKIINEYFPYRTNIVLDQLKEADLFTDMEAPLFTNNNEVIKEEVLNVESGYKLLISNPNSNNDGSIKFTLDGSDPRQTGGAISETASDGVNEKELTIYTTQVIKTRIKNVNKWSPLHEITINVSQDLSDLKITEIHYNPVDLETISGSELEFIELKNTGTSVLNLTACTFINGINYKFDANVKLNPNQFIVLSSNNLVFKQRYGFDSFGEYDGQLKNSGETVRMVNIAGDTILTVKYNDKTPWPIAADGSGNSIVSTISNPTGDANDAGYWRASADIGGSPMADDPVPNIMPVYINEALTNTTYPDVDAIELYNPNDVEVNIGGWYLTDNKNSPKKWRIPNNTILAPDSYFVFYNGHFDGENLISDTNEFGGENGFALSSHGEDLYIYSANNDGALSGFVHGFSFNDMLPNVSLGRYFTREGKEKFVSQKTNTFGEVNDMPQIGPIVFSKIMYHPENLEFEYIELLNISETTVNLFSAENNLRTWQIDGIDFDFPENISITSGEKIYIVEEELTVENFRLYNHLNDDVRIFNYHGKLQNEGEKISLKLPAPAYMDGTEKKYPYVLVEEVNYNNNSPWPIVNGNGKMLQRKETDKYADDPLNWIAGSKILLIKTPNLKNAVAGITYNETLISVGGEPNFNWSIDDGALPDGINLNSNTGVISGLTSEVGNFAITIKLTDSNYQYYLRNYTLTVNNNTAPILENDIAETQTNISVIIDVLDNDLDNDGDKDSWKLDISQKPIHGNVFISNDNQIIYIPSDSYIGNDQFEYSVSDISGTKNAIVNINVKKYVSVIELKVNSGNNDAEEIVTNNYFDAESSDLELLRDVSKGGIQLVGIRFDAVPIPADVTISNAYIQFKVDETSTEETEVVIYGEAADNSLEYSMSNKISPRLKTNASALWQPLEWTLKGEAGVNQQTSDISSVIQEIIDRDGWISGNSLAFICTGTGKRVAESFEGDQSGAPELYIEYLGGTIQNIIPIAAAGTNKEILQGKIVSLDGSKSSASSGEILNYTWSIIEKPLGSNAKLSNSYTYNPEFYADLTGKYTIELIVSDGISISETNSVVITVTNTKPIALVNSETTIDFGTSTVFDGSVSYDPDESELSFNWNIISKPEGSNTESITDIAKPNFTPDSSGEYTIGLVVNDGWLNSEIFTFNITIAENIAPYANAGIDQSIHQGETVSLDGSNSSDSEGSSLNYQWLIVSLPESSSTFLSDYSIVNPTFVADATGIYKFILIVNDNEKQSKPDTVSINVTNLQPVANAGNDQEILINETITLDGSLSIDPEMQIITYLWTLESKPTESNAVLSDNTIAKPTFKADIVGDYVFSLITNDGFLQSNIDEVTITVKPIPVKINIDNNISDLKIFPNPSSSIINLSLNLNTEKDIKISVQSIHGKLIKNIFTGNKNAGKHLFSIDFEQINAPGGIYFLRIDTGNSIISRKIVYFEK